MTDISERKATEEYINRLAFYDVLTQLPNRRLLQERMKHGIVRFQRTGNEMAVLMMDLDKFKAVNDTLGHAAGDELLQQVAKRIKDRLREVDMVARLGGDEFVVLIEDIKQHENLALIAESIIHTLSQVFTLGADHEVYIGVSIGIAICPEHGNSEEALMDNADIALYHAKAQGRGCFVYFSDALTQKIQEHAIMETRLRHAIEQQELYVFFQPQIDISSNQVVGAEAIVLWYHPTHGYFMPKDFLDLAEKTGLIIDIGEWLLRQTCKLGRQWLDEGLPAVILAVNVSPYQFRHVNVSKLVTQILEETGFPAQYLALEITETGLMENHENAQPILNILYEQGVHLVIDDFGKGFSSLTYLKHFPLDMLKIDKSFIDDLPYSQDDSAITASLIAMAHHLGFKVLAEGVETVPQLTFLRQQGCDKYQGVHSQALPANQFARLLLNLRDA
jgi:diguanylate cyclase (GGDEF)-like protein